MQKGSTRGMVVAVSSSASKGKKQNKEFIEIKKDLGVLGDVHAGTQRPLSLMSFESIERVCEQGIQVGCGDFGENITVRGVDTACLKIGDRLVFGKEIILEIIEKGKTCPSPCEIFYALGDCIMPREGIFCRVIHGGKLYPQDPVRLFVSH